MPDHTSTTLNGLLGHRFYHYRGCAPAPADTADFPGQSLGDPALPVTAWSGEATETEQEAAVAACWSCPLLEACRADALTETPRRVPEEIRGVRGGMLPGELRQAVTARRDHRAAWRALVDHRRYQYRGCAPSPDPAEAGLSLGDVRVPSNAWLTPYDEPQRDRYRREAAVRAVCAGCPVLDACRVYGLSEREGVLAEPADVWGGMSAVERQRVVDRRRRYAPRPRPAAPVAEAEEGQGRGPVVVGRAHTAQKQAVLAALAREIEEAAVAAAAGMDVRLANFHRSHLVRLLGLDRRTATRRELLDAAVREGLLPAGVWIRPDGPRPVIAAPNGDGSRQRALERARMPVQLVLPRMGRLVARTRPAPATAPPGGPGRAGGRSLRAVRPRAVQLRLAPFRTTAPRVVFPRPARTLEPAA